MANLQYTLNLNILKANKIFYNNSKEHPKIGKIAKFGCEMLENKENIASQSLQIFI